jgi:hypothetical protein
MRTSSITTGSANTGIDFKRTIMTKPETASSDLFISFLLDANILAHVAILHIMDSPKTKTRGQQNKAEKSQFGTCMNGSPAIVQQKEFCGKVNFYLVVFLGTPDRIRSPEIRTYCHLLPGDSGIHLRS